MSGPDFSEIKAGLVAAIEALAAELVPDGHRNGGYWIGRNPTRADRHAGSFWIRIKPPAIGAWRDEATGEKGDAVDLVRYVLRLRDRSETRAWCMRWLGMSAGGAPPSPAEKAARDRQIAAERDRREKEDAIERQAKSRRAFGLWLQAEEVTAATYPGSLMQRYHIEARGIDLVAHWLALGRPFPAALRFFPAHDYLCASGEILTLPCIAALMTGPAGKPQALHRTWLRPDGRDKAALPDPRENKPRKILGPPNGAVIRLAKGAGNMSPEQAEKAGRRGPLAVAEGVEDCLSLMMALPGWRVWAAGTVGNIGNVPVLPCVDRLVIAADNDESPEAKAGFGRALAKLTDQARGKGVAVKVARSPRGKDMNDLLKGEPT